MVGVGSTAFYKITTAIRDQLLELSSINTVTFGDIRDVDLNKQTIFPLAHVQVNNVALNSPTLDFSITVLLMDIVHQNKHSNIDQQTIDKTFFGVDNEQDVLNTQLAVANILSESLKRAQLRDQGYELIGSGSAEPFTDRFENKLAGWAISFNAYVRNDINICEKV